MQRLICLVALLAGVVAFETTKRVAMGQQATGKNEQSASNVLDKARQTLAAYSSIEYQFRSEGFGPGKQSNKSKRVETGEFAYADGKFYSEFTIDLDDYKNQGYTAFDGNVYQSMDDRGLAVIGEIARIPYHVVQPIMRPFASFLSDSSRGDRFDLDTYRGTSIWSPVQAKATLAQTREVDGH